MNNEFKVEYLYCDNTKPNNVHLCVKIDEVSDEVHFKQISGDFYLFYYNQEEKLWRTSIYWSKNYMVEIGPDCKALRVIYG